MSPTGPLLLLFCFPQPEEWGANRQERGCGHRPSHRQHVVLVMSGSQPKNMLAHQRKKPRGQVPPSRRLCAIHFAGLCQGLRRLVWTQRIRQESTDYACSRYVVGGRVFSEAAAPDSESRIGRIGEAALRKSSCAGTTESGRSGGTKSLPAAHKAGMATGGRRRFIFCRSGFLRRSKQKAPRMHQPSATFIPKELATHRNSRHKLRIRVRRIATW